MGLFNKDTSKKKAVEDDEDTIDASELLAINQEAARKEKKARIALMEKAEHIDDEEVGIEFEATTTIQNVSSLLNQINQNDSDNTDLNPHENSQVGITPHKQEATNIGLNVSGLTSKEHVDDVIVLKEKLLKIKFEQRFENQQFKEQMFKMLAPFEKSKNPNIRKHIQKIKKAVHDFTKDKE